MTRIEYIQRMIAGDLNAAHFVIFEPEDINGKRLSDNCTETFIKLGCMVFHNSDEFLWHVIRNFVFEDLIDDECKKLKQIRNPHAFDGWFWRVASRLVTTKKNKKKLYELAGLSIDNGHEEGELTDKEASSLDDEVEVEEVIATESETKAEAEVEIEAEAEAEIEAEVEAEIEAEVEAEEILIDTKAFKESENLCIMIEIYGTNDTDEFVHKLIEDYSSASLFGSKAQPTYAKILELKIIRKIPDKDIAKEIGVSHKNMSILRERAMLNLARFVTKKVKEYEQKNQ